MTALPVATHVIFNDGEARVPLSEVFAYADAYKGKHGYASPTGVVWQDGVTGYAKGWWFHLDDMRLCRVGAGAYGDMTILKRDR